jgi:hypothetical protein
LYLVTGRELLPSGKVGSPIASFRPCDSDELWGAGLPGNPGTSNVTVVQLVRCTYMEIP